MFLDIGFVFHFLFAAEASSSARPVVPLKVSWDPHSSSIHADSCSQQWSFLVSKAESTALYSHVAGSPKGLANIVIKCLSSLEAFIEGSCAEHNSHLAAHSCIGCPEYYIWANIEWTAAVLSVVAVL